MLSNELDAILADLRRQRADLDQRIRELEAQGKSSEILDTLKRWQTRAKKLEQIGPDDETVRLRR